MTPTVMVRAVCVLALAAGVLHAQESEQARPGVQRLAQRMAKQQRNADPAQLQRMQLQRRIREGFWRAAKVRIGFTDDQMLRLEQTSQRYDQRRRVLGQEEKALRVTLRNETLADSAANQSTIASSLERLAGLQHQRIDLQVEEDKEFAQFMTPLQRAKFLALQDQIRKRVAEIARGRPDSAGTQGVTPNVP